MPEIITADGTTFEYGDPNSDKVTIRQGLWEEPYTVSAARMEEVLNAVDDPQNLTFSDFRGLTEFASLDSLRQFAVVYKSELMSLSPAVGDLVKAIEVLPASASRTEAQLLIHQHGALGEKPNKAEAKAIGDATSKKIAELVKHRNEIAAVVLKFSVLNK